MYSVLDLQKLVQMLSFLGISPGATAPPHSVVLGGGTYAAPTTAGFLLASNGASVDPSFESLAALGIQPSLGYTPAHAGANSDITSLSGLTTALSIAQGGTGAITAALARTALGAAASGANADITSMVAPLAIGGNGTALTLTVDDHTNGNGANIKLLGNGATTPSKSIRADGGVFQVINDAYTAVLLTLTDAGDMTLAGHMASDFITFQQPGTGGIKRPLTSWLTDRTISVFGFGAVGNGSTDDSAAIQAALSNSPAGSTIVLPPVTYRLAAGITVPAGKTLLGLSLGGVTNQSTAVLLADLSVSVPVTVDGGGASGACGLIGVTVNRAAGAVPGGSIGVVVQNSNESILQDVYSFRSSIGYSVAGATNANLGIKLLRCHTSQITDAHVVISNSVETTFTMCRFGRNGGSDVACNAFVRISGATIDTVRFATCQFNQSGANVTEVLQFIGYAGNPNGIFTFAECHMETWASALVVCDATSTPARIKFIACTIDGSGSIYSGPAGALTEFILTGNTIEGGATLTLDQHVQSVITGNHIDSTVLVNQGSQVITGNYFAGGVTLQGVAVKTVFVGNAVGSLTNTMTGTTAIANNV